jgi:isoamyl acetate esterase
MNQCLAPRPAEMGDPKIRLLTIWFGANDACLKHSPQHVPLSRFTSNLENLVDMIQSPESRFYSPSTRVVLISPPPVNTLQRGADLGSRDPPLALDRDFETTKSYADAVRRVADGKQVGFVDVWTGVWHAAGEKEEALDGYLTDGLHLNEEGYKVISSTCVGNGVA